MMIMVNCETCNGLLEYIAAYAPEKCMVQEAAGLVFSDEEMDNYKQVTEIWTQHYLSKHDKT